ncbi:alpha/beta fold hydrolase BchO [Acidisphaera sp. L21]|uniref:alpha/beta fold hydrolase BchO n=1 Tax=Acidisphaera sp. L21 TaxID=1641851 RepID=UPI00131D4562|nr:alpha/beta fold hydrolase BchO [Acidisphaera sp. L21]
MSDRRNTPQSRLPKDWPNRGSSQFVRATGLVWHVQTMGSGPVLLLIHGTGAATHSWRDLAPILAQHFTVVAPDLPGHGFTESPAMRRLSLPGMALALQALLRMLNLQPQVAVGHSAGAAILARMALDGQIRPQCLVGLNAAVMPLGGIPGQLFSPLAKLLVGLPLLPELFAWRARDTAIVEKLLADTGSTLDARGVALYARLVRQPSHAAAALGMMAHWDLQPLLRALPRLRPPLLLIVGANDRTIPPADAVRIQALVPGATLATLPGLGHLAHEEAPQVVADLILDHARITGALSG